MDHDGPRLLVPAAQLPAEGAEEQRAPQDQEDLQVEEDREAGRVLPAARGQGECGRGRGGGEGRELGVRTGDRTSEGQVRVSEGESKRVRPLGLLSVSLHVMSLSFRTIYFPFTI